MFSVASFGTPAVAALGFLGGVRAGEAAAPAADAADTAFSGGRGSSAAPSLAASATTPMRRISAAITAAVSFSTSSWLRKRMGRRSASPGEVELPSRSSRRGPHIFCC